MVGVRASGVAGLRLDEVHVAPGARRARGEESGAVRGGGGRHPREVLRPDQCRGVGLLVDEHREGHAERDAQRPQRLDARVAGTALELGDRRLGDAGPPGELGDGQVRRLALAAERAGDAGAEILHAFIMANDRSLDYASGHVQNDDRVFSEANVVAERTSMTAEREVWREALGVVLATSAYGISFGALAVAAGLDVWQTCVLSLLMFTGGSQFAFVGVFTAGGLAALPSAIASAALLGVRNVAYGMRMSPVVGGGPARRALAAHFTIDESTAVAIAQDDPRLRRVGFWVTGVGIFLGWNLTTLVGALVGDVLGDPKAWGLDAAAAAAFLALLWPRLRQRQAVAVGIAAAVIAAALTPGGVRMTLWSAILLAALICLALKAVGHLVPPKVLEAPRPARISDLLTVALLAALVAVQSLGDGQAITVDARVPALLVAAGLLWLRQSFLVVVAAAALVAALLRLFGLAA
ncbi:unnamed protein product [Penicillium discolor]